MQLEKKILKELFEELVNNICDTVIAELIKYEIDDSELVNTWEVICVEMQGIKSENWHIHKDEITRLIKIEIEKLKPYQKSLIWLNTKIGQKLSQNYSDYKHDGFPFSDEDIVSYIRIEKVLARALFFTNDRISNYLDSQR